MVVVVVVVVVVASTVNSFVDSATCSQTILRIIPTERR